MNQDGYLFKGEIESNILDELRINGYINEGTFYELPVNNIVDIKPWSCILSLYHIQNAIPEVTYIMEQKRQLDLVSKIDSIIIYWSDNYNQLDITRPDAVKRPLRYDLSIVLSSMLLDLFTFSIDDKIPIKSIIYKDDAFKHKIVQATAAHKLTVIPINQGNINFWNGNYKQRKFSIKLNEIKKIIIQRCV